MPAAGVFCGEPNSLAHGRSKAAAVGSLWLPAELPWLRCLADPSTWSSIECKGHREGGLPRVRRLRRDGYQGMTDEKLRA